ncbi:MAG: metallophosphoesterase [Calditrichaeota bacterium]|nr:metallophosphoesterase [Calditrichota bacterium]
MLRAILALLILAIIEFYFVKKMDRVFDSKEYKKFRFYFLIYLNLFPVFGILYNWLRPEWIETDAYWLDLLLKFPFWFILLFILQFIIFYLPFELIKWLLIWLRKNKKESILKIERALILIIFLFFCVYMPVRVLYDWNTIDIAQFTYKKENLPADLIDFKIVLISDLQADKYTNGERLQNYIDLVNQQEPDLILIAGDLITGTPDYITTAAAYVGQLKAKYGVYSSIGDHDNWSYRGNNERSIGEMREALAPYNVPMLDNDTLDIQVGDAEIHSIFLTYTYSNRREDGVYTDLLKNSKKADLNIVVSHQPRPFLIEWAEESHFDLFLAGHTHGGQITFLTPFTTVTPTQFETSYVKEDYWYKNLYVIVSKGIGASFVPFRLNATPNISVIILEKRN